MRLALESIKFGFSLLLQRFKPGQLTMIQLWSRFFQVFTVTIPGGDNYR